MILTPKLGFDPLYYTGAALEWVTCVFFENTAFHYLSIWFWDPCSVAVSLGFWNSEHDETWKWAMGRWDGPLLPGQRRLIYGKT